MIPSTPPPRIPAINTNPNIDFTIDSPTNHDNPAFHISISPRTPISPNAVKTKPSHGSKSTNRAQTESRKLLAHVLDQLDRRTLPPSVFDAFDTPEDQVSQDLGAFLETVKGAVKLRKQKQETKLQPHLTSGEDDSDDDRERGFSTDETYNLMLQLKDLLIMSVDQAWHLFDNPVDESSDNEAGGRHGISPFRRSRASLQPAWRDRSSSPSASEKRQPHATNLLSSCISVLASVVAEDCRYQVASPRPSRPPNALQALVVDVARFLLHLHRQDPIIISKIGFAMMPAFVTFRPEMHGRLLAFFETSVIESVLNGLEQIQGTDYILTSVDGWEKSLINPGSPIVAIHIDSVQETSYSAADHSPWSPWSSSPDNTMKLRSSIAPHHSLTVYLLSSLIAPLLATILECVDLELHSGTHTDVRHYFVRLLRLIVERKIDAYSDLLQIVGYHSSLPRRTALSILSAAWPKALGHITISRPLSEAHLLRECLYPTHSTDTCDLHHFIPWSFPSQPSRRGTSQYDCQSCLRPVYTSGLLCPLCLCVVHCDCYNHAEDNCQLRYSLASNLNIQRVAMYRFSENSIGRQGLSVALLQRQRHQFRPVNIHTLCLCVVCHMPLWGGIGQGHNCVSCMSFIHPTCLSDASASDLLPCSTAIPDSSCVDIEWDDLRRSCINFYHDIFSISHQDLATRSFEEVSIIHSTMWSELEILKNGMTSGSIVVGGIDVAKHREVDFELHQVILWCVDLLSSGNLPCSDAMDDYMEENRLLRSKHLMMFDWSNLAYILSIVKSPYARERIPNGSSSDLLSVSHPERMLASPSETSTLPFEAVALSHMRDALGYCFNVHSDSLAKLLLSRLHHLGLFQRIDLNPILFDHDKIPDIYCAFPLPLGLDLSPTVETLVSAIEACLHDVDLSVNEIGFLLLSRRLCPNGLSSDYALRRLSQSVLCWVLAEDDHLAIVLRDYLAKQKNLPGVRSSQDPVPWPSPESSRPAPSGSANNGGDYLATRRALLTRYVKPWLLALHDLDTTIYAELLYDVSSVHDVLFPAGRAQGAEAKNRSFNDLDNIIRRISRLTHFSVIFTVFDDLLLHWLDAVSTEGLYEKNMPSLFRLFPREIEASDTYFIGSEQANDFTDQRPTNPWRVVTRIAAEGKCGLNRSLRWLCLFACSGVEIPLAIFKTFSILGTKCESSLTEALLLAKAIMASTWLKSRDRQELQTLLSDLHARLLPQIMKILSSGSNDDCISFIRISLATCLLLYGCDRAKLTELKMVREEDIKGLPSRRKLNVRNSIVVDPMIVDPRLMDVFNNYMATNIENILCLVSQFLYLFLMDSPYLEAYEVDNFILRNGRLLAHCAWQIYDVQNPELSNLRPHFLLRILVVDFEPFRNTLETCFFPTSNWERRYLAVTRLFRIILDVTNPFFNIEDRQWQSSVTDIFYYFFTALWADEKEELRLAVHALSASLLPAHFEAISACWNESLTKTPIIERIKLVTFLIQLRPYFPSWKVLSWNTIVEAILEDEHNKHDPAAAHMSLYGLTSVLSDPDLATLRASIVLLSMQMIADGIGIDSFMLLKVKNHLVEVLGFRDISVVPARHGQSFQVQFGEITEIPNVAFPCVNQLLSVMDSPHTVDLAPSTMAGAMETDDRPVAMLVGSALVDAFLVMFCTVKDLISLPVLIFKNMLETLCVIIYKHDFDSKPLRHLQHILRRAVLRALEVLTTDVSYDLRQLSLSVTQAYVKRWSTIMGSFVYVAFESVANLVASQHQHGQDALVAQAKAFLDTTLMKYAHNGLFANLLKRSLNPEFFLVIKQVVDANAKSNPMAPQTLRELLLRDILSRNVDADQTVFQTVLNNIQTYVDVVFYQGYSIDLIQFVGQQSTHFARRSSEWNPDTVNSDPLLMLCSTLLQHNKSRSRDLIPYIDTLLRVLLNRSQVGAMSLFRLLQVTTSLYKKTETLEAMSNNSLVPLIFEILGDGLRLKSRVLPSTLKSMFEALMMNETPSSLPTLVRHLPSFLGLVDPAIHFLQNHSWQDVENDFVGSLAVARMLLQVSGQDPTVMSKIADYGAEKGLHTNLKIRSWSILTLAALLEPKEDWCTMLLTQLPSLSYAYHWSMRIYVQGTNSVEPSTSSINHAYIATKLWVLLAHRISGSSNTVNGSTTYNVWNELWPPFEDLVSHFEADIGGELYLTLGSLVLPSVADLFIFVKSLHNPIALNTSSHIATLNRLRNLGPGETVNQKLARALRYMSEPPSETSFETLVNQVAKDIVAAEKLRIVEAKIVPERKGPERHRRDLRTIT